MLCNSDTQDSLTGISGDQYDVAIIGGGAAGLSAALVLSRARRRVLVVDAGAPRNAPAAHMHGFLSRDGLPPSELLAIGRDEVTGYGSSIVADRVTAVSIGDGGRFHVMLAAAGRVIARRLLVATGLRDEIPDIPGLRERWGRDVLHCPYCHGWEVRDRRLAVLGSGAPEHIRYAQVVRQWSQDLVLFVPVGGLADQQRQELVARGIGIIGGDVAGVRVQDDELTGVEMTSGDLIGRDAVFVPPRFVPNNDLLVALCCKITDDGWVATDSTGRTTVSGVWVAGNVANPRAQVITAAGEGSSAAIALNTDLVDEDVRDSFRA